LVPKFTLNGYDVPVLNESGKEGVNIASLHIAGKGAYIILTLTGVKVEVKPLLSVTVSLNFKIASAVSHVASNLTTGVLVLFNLTIGPAVCSHE
jgi:hypothetical protein